MQALLALLAGAILAVGPRTVAAALRVMGMVEEPAIAEVPLSAEPYQMAAASR